MPTRRSLLEYSIPQPADPALGPGTSPPLGLLRTAENVSAGIGDGEVNQLRGLLGMVQHPIQTLNALNEIGRRPSQWVPMIGNALQSSARNAMSGPLGFGQVIGENVGPRTLFGGNAMRRDMVAHHGSPHDFDQFDSSKIGTGEGAQAYGHGLYFAESPGTARTYQWMAPSEVRVGDERIIGKMGVEGRNDPTTIAWNEVTVARDGQYENPFAVAKQRLAGKYGPKNKNNEQAIRIIEDWQRRSATVQPGGRFYTVDIPDDAIDKMLDWDKPLSEQPQSVRQALKFDVVKDVGDSDSKWLLQLNGKVLAGYKSKKEALSALSDSTAGEFYSTLAIDSPKKASEYLRSLGIPGIRYLDAGSRGTGNGTRNFVVFDDKLVKILKKE